MRILVTGAAGFVSSPLAERLARELNLASGNLAVAGVEII